MKTGFTPVFRAITAILLAVLISAQLSSLLAGGLSRQRQPKEHDESIVAAALSKALEVGLANTADIYRQDEPFPAWVCLNSQGEIIGYVVDSSDYTTDVTGYGGPLEMWIGIDSTGGITGADIGRNYETPSYLRELKPFIEQLTGIKCADSLTLGQNIDAMTRATISSEAILKAIRIPLTEISEALEIPEVYNTTASDDPGTAEMQPTWWQTDYPGLLIRGTLLCLILLQATGYGGKLTLTFASILSVIWLGFINVTMISTSSLARLLTSPAIIFSHPQGPMIALALVSALLFGWLYCAMACPLGHLLRWIRKAAVYVVPALKGLDARPRTRNAGIIIPILLLFTAIAGHWSFQNTSWLAIDPFAFIFARIGTATDAMLAAYVLITSAVVPRFWCRYLCPVGGTIRLISRFGPAGFRLGGISRRPRRSIVNKKHAERVWLFHILVIAGIILMLTGPVRSLIPHP